MTPTEQTATTIPAPAVVKQCSKCGAVFTQAEWNELPRVGRAEDGKGGFLKLRNCTRVGCTSTISMPVTS